jgi:hypothetical protein
MKGVSYTLKINLNKDKFKEIDNAFSVLQEDLNNNAACNIIKESLESCFGYTFRVTVIPVTDTNQPFFVMSVYPDMDTVTKIITALSGNDNKKDKTISKLWEQTKEWTIEIDPRILSFEGITNRELTALLLHEVGHIVFSNSIPYRVTTILQYELAKTRMENKILIRDRFFRKLLSLPILNACVADSKNADSIKIEIKADTFAQKMGYTKELTSILNKLIKSNKYPKNASIDKNMKDTARFSIETVDQFRKRHDQLVKNNLISLKKECTSVYIGNAIQECYNTYFEDHEDSSVQDGKKLLFMQERADKIIDKGIFTEAFLFKGKLKRIDPAELDYIDIKATEIKTESDKMMLISYLHNKLDLIEYYISIMEDPKLSKKYTIPHTLAQLRRMRDRLLQSRINIINFKIPERTKGLLIAWPKNYEG